MGKSQAKSEEKAEFANFGGGAMESQKSCTSRCMAQPLEDSSFGALGPTFRLSGPVFSRPCPWLPCMGATAGWAGRYAREAKLGPVHQFGWRVVGRCLTAQVCAATHLGNVPHG